jgi:hypothetical protein
MRTLTATLVSTVLVVPGVVFAQSGDAKYCAALSDKYESYIETAGDKGGHATPTEVVLAMDRCKSDPGSAIPILEKQLKAAKLDLPPRG